MDYVMLDFLKHHRMKVYEMDDLLIRIASLPFSDAQCVKLNALRIPKD